MGDEKGTPSYEVRIAIGKGTTRYETLEDAIRGFLEMSRTSPDLTLFLWVNKRIIGWHRGRGLEKYRARNNDLTVSQLADASELRTIREQSRLHYLKRA